MNSSHTETVPAIRFSLEVYYREEGDPIHAFVGVIPVRILKDKGEVPIYDDEKAPDNYQRELKTARVEGLANSLRGKKVELPTAVLLNIRDLSVEKIYKNGCLDFSLANKIYVVDGQHRIAALKKLMQEEEDDKKIKRVFFNYKIPFVCLVGATLRDEMRQFYLVNKNAKPLDASLRYKHMKGVAEIDWHFKALLKLGREDVIVEAQNLLELLIKTPLWKDRIKMPNAKKKSTTLPSASMNKSLHGFVQNLYVKNKENEERVKIYNIYWESIRKILPEAFAAPEKYSIQKGVGVRVLTDMFSQMLEIVRDKTKKVDDYTEEDFVNILKPLKELSDENGNRIQVSGHEIWLTGPSGAMNKYAGEAGFKTLKNRITHFIIESLN